MPPGWSKRRAKLECSDPYTSGALSGLREYFENRRQIGRETPRAGRPWRTHMAASPCATTGSGRVYTAEYFCDLDRAGHDTAASRAGVIRFVNTFTPPAYTP